MDSISIEEHQQIISTLLHRVKNNFQLILSLVNLQNDFAADLERDESSNRLMSRINAIALVQELVYRNEKSRITEASPSSATQYLKFHDLGISIIDFLSGVYSHRLAPDAIRFECNDAYVESHDAIALALVLNELLLNGIVHGNPVPGDDAGIQIRGTKNEDSYLLEYHQANTHCPLDEAGYPVNQKLGTMLICNYGAQLGSDAIFLNEGEDFRVLMHFPAERFRQSLEQ